MNAHAFQRGYLNKEARVLTPELITAASNMASSQGISFRQALSKMGKKGGSRGKKPLKFKPKKTWFDSQEGKRYLAETSEGVDTDTLAQLRNKDAADTTGLADKAKTSLKDVNPDELKKGMKVEMEHTKDSDLAQEIALDHLTESPDYYTKLQTMEED